MFASKIKKYYFAFTSPCFREMIKLRVLLKNVEKRRERAQEEEKTFMDMVEKEKESPEILILNIE